MNQTAQILQQSTPEIICQYLSTHLHAEIEEDAGQFRIKGQGGLFVDKKGRIAKPADGKQAGGKGLLPAIIYCKTGGNWTADKQTFKESLQEACEILNIPIESSISPPLKKKKKPPVNLTTPTTIYSYTDEDGKELYQNCRFEWEENSVKKKTFRQRHYDHQQQKWIWNLEGCRIVPYNLPAVLAEPDAIFDVEGEKDVESLRDLTLTAINLGKDCQAWEHFKNLAIGRLVIVCEDNDPAGKKSAQARAKFWFHAGAVVKVLTFHSMPEKSDVTDWIDAGGTFDELWMKIQNIPEFTPLSDITITFKHVPTQRRPLITIDGQTFLEEGKLAGIVSGIGKGKSHLIEMFAAIAINPGCEIHARSQVSLDPGEKIVIVDTERTRDDCFYSLRRMYRRLNEDDTTRTADHSEFLQVRMVSLTDISSICDRRARLVEIFETNSTKMIFIDGILDFLLNPNDIDQSTELVMWLYAQALQHHVGVLYTIHGNRNDSSGKGKGWIGDVIQRKSAGFLYLIDHPKRPDVRVLTSNFENRKIRHGRDHDINLAMTWSESINAFIFIPYDEDGEISSDTFFIQCFDNADKEELSYKELSHHYRNISGFSESTFKRHLKMSCDLLMTKTGNMYRLRD